MSAGKPMTPDPDWPDYGSAADRDRELVPGMTDEWTDDDPPEPSGGLKLIHEANRLQSLALRALAGEEIDWDGGQY